MSEAKSNELSAKDRELIQPSLDIMRDCGIKMTLFERQEGVFECKWEDIFYLENQGSRLPGKTVQEAARAAYLCAKNGRINLGKAELPDCFST